MAFVEWAIAATPCHKMVVSRAAVTALYKRRIQQIKNPRPKPGVLFSEEELISAGRLVGRPVQASVPAAADQAAAAADQASAGRRHLVDRRLVGHHPGRLAGSAGRPDSDYSRS